MIIRIDNKIGINRVSSLCISSFHTFQSESVLGKDQFSGIIGLAPPSNEEKSTVPAFIS